MKKVSHKKVYLQTLSLAVLGMFAFTHTASAEGLDFGLSNTLTNAGNAAASGIKTAAGQVNLTKAAVTAIKGGGTTQLKAAGGALAKAATMGAASSAINSVVGTNVMSANGSISTGGVMKAVTQSSAFKSATSNIASTLGLSPGASGTLANDASRLVTTALTGGNVSAVAGQMATAALNTAKKAATDYVTGVKDRAIAAAQDKARELGNNALESGKTELKNAYASYMDGKSLGDVASTGFGNLSDSLSLGSLTSNGNLSDLGSTFSSSLGSGGIGNIASSLGGGSIGNIVNTVSSMDMGKIGKSVTSFVSGSPNITGPFSGVGFGGLGGPKASTAVWQTS